MSGMSALAEEIIIARDIMLAASAKCKLHIAHISTAKSIDLVRNAKKNGLAITAEVTPHHLLLNEEATASFDPNTKMKPPLRTETDRLACIEGLNDGTIDFIATDHAPHADFEKCKEFNYAPFGVIGLETAFATLYDTFVKKGKISLERLVEAMSIKPGEFIGTNNSIEEGNTADLSVIDLNSEIEFIESTLVSKAKNTPFINQKFTGKIDYTICEGEITWQAE